MERQRFVDVEKLTEEQLQQLSGQIGEKVKALIDQACADANRILSVYGLKALVQVEIKSKDFDNSKGE